MAGARSKTEKPDFELERQLIDRHRGAVAGIDEAGRGPWAGPVVAAAVILDGRAMPDGLDDSKRLSERARERLYQELVTHHQVGVGIGDVERIDQHNILQATLWSMAHALGSLTIAPVAALVDGNKAPNIACHCQTVIGGDRRSLSVAAASIIAKVTRDRMMVDLAISFPAYGWETNKGYGTKLHAQALEAHGVTPHHRRSFKPVAEALARLAA